MNWFRYAPGLSAAALLSACGGEASAPAQDGTPGAEATAEATRISLLRPLEAADAQGLDGTASCRLVVNGENYLQVARGQGAVRTTDGRVALTDVPIGIDDVSAGGRYTAGDVSIQIQPSADETELNVSDRERTRVVQVTASSGATVERFDGDWVCTSEREL